MLTTRNPSQTLWETILPECLLPLQAGLAEVDELLDDPAFFEPFRRFFSARLGRPSIPVETYLRMMYLRFRYRLGYEVLCREVTDSLAWRRFCRIALGERVPHPSTLEKITSRCGEELIGELNERLLAKAADEKVLRLDKVRVDTTVLPANVAYPTDSGLLAKGVAKMARLVKRLQEAGLASRTATRDRTRSVRRRAHEIGAWLRRRSDEAKAEVLAIVGELARIGDTAAAEAMTVSRNARRSIARAGGQTSGRVLAMIAELERTAALMEQIVAQTRVRVSGEIPDGSERIVSLHDTDARPIRKGRLGKPVEFGYKAQIADNKDGIVLDHEVLLGNPPDAPLLAPAIARIHKRFGRTPRAVTADRGYGEAGVEDSVRSLGVKNVVIPRKGKPSAARREIQRKRGFVALVKWRTGSEARISILKHGWGWSRTLMDGEDGARTWAGWGVFGHNANKISHLVHERAGPPGKRATPSA
jgi:IS5 family transposase